MATSAVDSGVPPFAGWTFLVMGAPASGKGTQCKLLAERYGLVHLSTGDIFREAAAGTSELGEQARGHLVAGSYVPDDVVIPHVLARLAKEDVQERGCLLDGFPRTELQARAVLSAAGGKMMAVVIQVPDKALALRAKARRVDPETGAIYSLRFNPPPEDEDVAARLVRRDLDDNKRKFAARIACSHQALRRVLPSFAGRVATVNGLQHIDAVTAAIDAVILKAVEDAAAAAPAVGAVQAASCIVCFDAPAEYVVVPCGHQCGCGDCLRQIQQTTGKCPVCREDILTITRVYQSGRVDDGAAPVASASSQGLTPPVDARLEDLLDGPQAADVLAYDEWPDEEEAIADAASVGVEIAPCSDVARAGGAAEVMVRVTVPDEEVRVPTDLCCVIDVSGSMGSKATCEADGFEVEDTGLTTLDIVKHAVKTVLHLLKDGDRASIVAFSERARTVFDLGYMTDAGRDSAIAALDALAPEGRTNIWDGVQNGLDALRGGERRQKTLLVLTDGQPNITPPRGHLHALREYKEAHPDFAFQLNSFGFGYNLDSELLVDLASAGAGTFAFIPDAVIVGTTFVNCIANVLSTRAQGAELHLTALNGASFAAPPCGGLPVTETSWGPLVDLGTLQYGQARDVVVPMHVPAGAEAYLQAVVRYTPTVGGGDAVDVRVEGAGRAPTAAAVAAALRAKVVDGGAKALTEALAKRGQSAVKAHEATAQAAASAAAAHPGDAVIAALHADAAGRMGKALQGLQRFHRWGRHYLRALVRAHQLQLCTNYMDPGLQVYGGTLFSALRDEGDATFLSLPPPTPSRPQAQAGRPAQAAAAPAMQTYYAGAGGGCFGANCTVGVAGAARRVADLRQGDRVAVAGGGTAAVRCVVEIARPRDRPLVKLPGGLEITSRHPIRVGSKWVQPGAVAPRDARCAHGGVVYNVVLDATHVVLVDGVECVTLGHGLSDPGVEHPYFGSRIVDDLSVLPGWQTGRVRVAGFARDASGDVNGILPGAAMAATP